jgi:UDPglucose 6-dehydrogenase
MKAIVDSNHTRKEYIASKIKETKSKIVGIYRLVMKSNSDNFRESAILDVIELLKQHGQEIVIYEPLLKVNHIDNIPIAKSFKEFVNTSNLILANRVDATLKPYSEKIFSRSISNEN